MFCLWLLECFRHNNTPLLNTSQENIPTIEEIEYTHIKN
jgi:hypothetical protein